MVNHRLPGFGRWGQTRRGLGAEAAMDGKARLILAVLMSSVMVAMVTLLVTFLNLGLRADFVLQWVKAMSSRGRLRRRLRI
jgi:uncharacterized protein DUF2798